MLEIDHFSLHRQGQHYLFHATAPCASITLIRGASGIGKSTLLDCLAGFETPQSGSLRWNGQEFQHQPVHERPLSLLQQKDNLFPHLNVLDNVCLGAGSISATGQMQAMQILERLGLAEIAAQNITDISGGQAQRVGLARALLRHQYSPRPILLLDEPYSALDEETADTIHQLMLDLCQQHKLCILLVAHREVTCDQVWELAQHEGVVGLCTPIEIACAE